MIQEYFNTELFSGVYLGLPLDSVQAVIRLNRQRICAMPGIASFWLGVTNYQGALLWVLNTDSFFTQLTSREETLTNHHPSEVTAVILQMAVAGVNKKVAVAVKQLKGVTKFTDFQISDVPNPQLAGICQNIQLKDEKKVYLLDSNAFLSHLHQVSLFSH